MSASLREHIVSFRVPKEQAEEVEKRLKAKPIVGVKSVNQWFRKAGLDLLVGRVSYKDPADMLMDNNA